MKTSARLMLLIAMFSCICLTSNAEEVEAPPRLKATDILPESLTRSSVYSVEEGVTIDRFMLGCELKSAFGVYKVNSKEMLRIRARELQILSHAKDISGMEQFADSLKDSVVQVPIGVAETVFTPVASAKKVGEGVKSKFAAFGGFVSGREKSHSEDNSIKETTIGAHKRGLAIELGLDVYSTNPKVQQLLNHLARARALGAAPVRLGGMVAPPGVGLALTVIRLRKDIDRDLATRSPNELHMLNNGILKKLNIPEPIRDAFNDNPFYSPRHKTAIAADLDAMKDVEGLHNFLATTLDDDSEEEALFAERQADMLLVYHKQCDKIEQIGKVGNLPVASTRSGNMAVLAPLDYLFLNEQSVRALSNLDRIAGDIRAKDRIIVISGFASAAFKRKASSMGFSLVENFGERVSDR